MKASKALGESQKEFPFWAWCLFFLGLWQVLLWAQSPSILMDDSGEMVAASWNLGLPHPPGYPLFDLLGHIFSWIPVGTVAFRFNLMSSLIIFISLSVVLKTCLVLADKMKLNGSLSRISVEWLLIFTALAFFFSEIVFSQCLSAKGCVYALTLLLISVLIWVRVSRKPVVYFVWFLWGLGLANHWQTIILLTPFLVLTTFSRWKTNLKDFIFMGFSSILGLSLYLYLPFRAVLSAQPFWGFPLRWVDFKWVVFRQLVTDEEMKIHSFSFYTSGLLAILKSYQSYVLGVVVLAAVGLWVICRHERKMARDFLTLFLPIVLALTLIHEEYNLYLMPVYLMPLSGLTVFLSFVGLSWLLARRSQPFQTTVIFIFILFSAFCGLSVFENQNKAKYMLAEDFGVNVMKFMPRGSVLLVDGDNYVMPLWYAKYVMDKRRDLVIEPMVFLYHDWGWNQMTLQANDLKEVTQSTSVYAERLTRLAQNTRHPFFYSFGRQFWPETLNRIKGNWSVRGLAYGWTLSMPTDKNTLKDLIRVSSQERLRGLKDNIAIAMEDPPTDGLYHSYGEGRLAAANWLRDHQDDLAALKELDSVLSILPNSAVVYANMASLVGQKGYLKMAQDLCRIAIELDPANRSARANLVKLNSLGANHAEDKSASDYRKWSETLEKTGCPFLSRLAFQYSEKSEKPLN